MFRIDSEHVIDATISGGPARWKINLNFFNMPAMLALDAKARNIHKYSKYANTNNHAWPRLFMSVSVIASI